LIDCFVQIGWWIRPHCVKLLKPFTQPIYQRTRIHLSTSGNNAFVCR